MKSKTCFYPRFCSLSGVNTEQVSSCQAGPLLHFHVSTDYFIYLFPGKSASPSLVGYFLME